jgi:hypothetical protein
MTRLCLCLLEHVHAPLLFTVVCSRRQSWVWPPPPQPSARAASSRPLSVQGRGIRSNFVAPKNTEDDRINYSHAFFSQCCGSGPRSYACAGKTSVVDPG